MKETQGYDPTLGATAIVDVVVVRIGSDRIGRYRI